MTANTAPNSGGTQITSRRCAIPRAVAAATSSGVEDSGAGDRPLSAVILPITTFVVVQFIYQRLASDRELTVMRSAGRRHEDCNHGCEDRRQREDG